MRAINRLSDTFCEIFKQCIGLSLGDAARVYLGVNALGRLLNHQVHEDLLIDAAAGQHFGNCRAITKLRSNILNFQPGQVSQLHHHPAQRTQHIKTIEPCVGLKFPIQDSVDVFL